MFLRLSVTASIISLVSISCGSPATGSGEHDNAPAAKTQSFHLAYLGGMAAGGKARSTTYWLRADGQMQIATSRESGRLQQLCDAASTDARGLIAAWGRECHGAVTTAGPPSSPMVAEYFPDEWVMTKVSGSHVARHRVPADRMPPACAAWIQSLQQEAARAEWRPAAPGLYGRAQRLPDFDPAIEGQPMQLAAEDLENLPSLAQVVEREMAWRSLADDVESLSISTGQRLAPGRALWLEIDGRVYVLEASFFAGAESVLCAPASLKP